MNKVEHLLGCLVEECAEVQKAVLKALRFGLDDGSPDGTTTNAKDIQKELNDIFAVVELLDEEGIMTCTFTQKEINMKKEKVRKYMDYARKRGTLKDKG